MAVYCILSRKKRRLFGGDSRIQVSFLLLSFSFSKKSVSATYILAGLENDSVPVAIVWAILGWKS